jgi:hypothetical protein
LPRFGTICSIEKVRAWTSFSGFCG